MNQLREVSVPAVPLSVLRPLVGAGRQAELEEAAQRSRRLLQGRVVWNVNSTPSGGGVSEMLHVLVGYVRGSGIDARWLVIEADPLFFEITKRIHNRLHGRPGDGGELGSAEKTHFDRVAADNAEALLRRASPGDIALLHDPQTAGMAPRLAAAGLRTIWRSHIGTDVGDQWTEQAWEFLRPYIEDCDAFVFSRRSYAPAFVSTDRLWVIPPSIDPFSLKNRDLSDSQKLDVLWRAGLIEQPSGHRADFVRDDGTKGTVKHAASIVSEGRPLDPSRGVVVQVSRWDRLKDMQGVMTGFASGVVGRVEAGLVLAGPAVQGVTDDPEGAAVLAECIASWEALPAAARRQVWIVCLPMQDVEENALMVNAVQRAATVIVQKSLVEGFGLTVAEGMWKTKAVLASATGGIVDQIAPGTGVLLDDPTDLDAFGDALASLLERPELTARLGQNAHRHVLDQFVGDRHLRQYATLVAGLLDP